MVLGQGRINNKLLTVILFLIISLFFTFNNISNERMIHILDDEFGYWGNAASMIGYDWNDLMSETAFYSSGYSFLLVPLMLFIHNPFALYKMAIAINGLLFFGQLVLAYSISKDIFHIGGKLRYIAVIVSLVGIAPVFYIHFTESETLIGTLYLAAIYFLNRIELRNSYLWVVSLEIILMWMIVAHRRTIPVAILLALSMFGILYKKRENIKLIFSFGGMLFFYFIYKLVMTYQILNIYGNSSVSSDNSASMGTMVSEYVQKVLNDSDVIIQSFICKLGMASISTYGTVLFIFVIFPFVLHEWRNKDWLNFSVAKACIVLSALSMIVLEALQMSDFTYRRDMATYTRYFDFVLPLVIMYGFSILVNDYEKFRKYYLGSWLVTFCTIPCMYFATIKSDGDYNALCSPILGAFYHIGYIQTGKLYEDKIAFSIFFKVFFFVTIVILLCLKNRNKSSKLIFFIIFVCCILWIENLSGEWANYRRDKCAPPSIDIYNYIRNDNDDIYCLKDDIEVRYPKYIQYLIGNREIKVIDSIEEIDKFGKKWVLTRKNYENVTGVDKVYGSWLLNLYRLNFEDEKK